MFSLGPVTFHLYGLMIGLGILAGVGVAERLAGKQREIAEKSLIWILIGGLIGARLYHVLDFWEYYSAKPLEIVAVWNGGLGIFGAIAGGVVGAWLTVRNRAKLIALLDLAGIGLPLGQAIGRLGNWFNRELFPYFAYEMIWDLIVFGAVYWLVKKAKVKVGSGGVFVTYLGLYGLGRFFLEFLRIENWSVYGVNVAQAISVGLIIGALIFWLPKVYSRSHLGGGTSRAGI